MCPFHFFPGLFGSGDLDDDILMATARTFFARVGNSKTISSASCDPSLNKLMKAFTIHS